MEYVPDLDIRDDYQTGEIRSANNLSGGESFIESLALAPGLSGMARRNVQIDSLFLDKGFGALDNETFEAAFDHFPTFIKRKNYRGNLACYRS
jgi:DNA repair protein SbcC/Rad50